MINQKELSGIKAELGILKDNYQMTHSQMIELNLQANQKQEKQLLLWNELRKESEDKWNELRIENRQTLRWTTGLIVSIMVLGFGAIGTLGTIAISYIN
jgi:hypothetical protein